MQPMRQLARILETLADADHYIFSVSDLRSAIPDRKSWEVLLCRAQKAGVLRRVCRGIYLYPRVGFDPGLVLFHAAARLRAGEFNYLSLETALSDAGVISQVPINCITLMSSGRTQTVSCGDFGRIEFVHTAQKPADVRKELTYDAERRLWRASVRQALRDMRVTRRSLELVSQEVLRELV
jgi:predicted transcriptional regulator of viral defense system